MCSTRRVALCALLLAATACPGASDRDTGRGGDSLADASLFARADEVEAAWRVGDPIINAGKEQDAPRLLAYEPGLWGPDEAAEWMRAQGREWFDTCPVLA